MSRTMLKLLVIAVVLTVAAFGLWLATGAHPYTKYQDVTREEVPTDENDPFANAGFYDGDTVTQPSRRTCSISGCCPHHRACSTST